MEQAVTRALAPFHPPIAAAQPGSARSVYEAGKRLLDISVSLVALLLLLPLAPLVALAIKLDSPGPVLFRQTRLTREGRPFKCWKLRSMYTNAEARRAELDQDNQMEGGVTFKVKNDPRITPVGHFIRKASIDELPQLLNVLVGDMALVGPRPALPGEVAQYTPRQRGRLAVKAGLTCLWQVSGRSDLPFAEQVRLDLAYVEGRTLLLDLSILLRTVPAVLLARGAY